MIILDTNVLSALMRHSPEPAVVAWMDRQPRTSLWTTSVTVLEVRFGLQILPGGKRRSALMQAFDTMLEKIGGWFVGVVVDFVDASGGINLSRQIKRLP